MGHKARFRAAEQAEIRYHMIAGRDLHRYHASARRYHMAPP